MSWQAVTQQADQLGESPFWHPAEQALYWIDIPGRQIRRLVEGSPLPQSWAMPQEPGCIAPIKEGGLVVALRDGVHVAPQWGGALTRIARAPYDTALARFNDGKADPLGRLWAGTIYEPRDKAAAVLYSLDCRGAESTLSPRVASGATVANGLAFSPDARTLYWADTTSHTVRAWDWDAVPNVLSNQRVLRRFDHKPAGWQAGMPGYGGRPDGATVDADGNYYVAMFEGARLVKLSPTGEVLAEFPLPVQCPTMPCLGGADLRTLYVTTASHNRPERELQEKPLSGCVLSMRVDVPGLPVNWFRAPHGID